MIDNGQVSVALSGWFGAGRSSDPDSPDNADLTVVFYDDSGNMLPGLKVGPVTAQERNGQIGMWKRSGIGAVPVGARLVRGRPDIQSPATGLRTTPTPTPTAFPWSSTNATPPTIGGIISLGDFGALPNFTGGSLIEIYGSNLATATRKWSGADFTGSKAPTALEGTSVTVNGKSAFVAFISPGQVNVQVPGRRRHRLSAGHRNDGSGLVERLRGDRETSDGRRLPGSRRIQGGRQAVCRRFRRTGLQVHLRASRGRYCRRASQSRRSPAIPS